MSNLQPAEKKRVSKYYSGKEMHYQTVPDEDLTRLGGRPIIFTLYVIAIAIAGLMGGVIGSIGLRDLQAVSYFGIVIFEPTPIGLAAFGMTTVGAVFGSVLLLVTFVSKRYVTE